MPVVTVRGHGHQADHGSITVRQTEAALNFISRRANYEPSRLSCVALYGITIFVYIYFCPIHIITMRSVPDRRYTGQIQFFLFQLMFHLFGFVKRIRLVRFHGEHHVAIAVLMCSAFFKLLLHELLVDYSLRPWSSSSSTFDLIFVIIDNETRQRAKRVG